MKKEILGAAFMRAIAKIVDKRIPPGWGFCIIVFPFNQPGVANYISNATRETMIEALREKIRALEGKKDFQTPEEN